MAIDPNWVRENPEEAARQIELLTIERDQYRAAEEAQIALRAKAVEGEQTLAAHVEEISSCLLESGRIATRRLKEVIGRSPTTSLALRDLIKQAEALSALAERKDKEAESEDDAALKSKCAYAAVCAANESNKLRRLAAGGV